MFDADVSAARRHFLGRAAAGSAALLVAGSGAAGASVPPQGSTLGVLPADGEWMTKLHGAHRQYFDIISWNSGFGQAYARNWANSMKSTYGLQDADVCAVIGLRHMGIAPAFSEAIWQKYRFGTFFNIIDPKTKAPATRNYAYHEAEGDYPLPGAALNTQIAAGAVVTVCNLATSVLSRLAANAAGLSNTPEEAYEDFKAHLQPGCYLVPTGVLATHRAQVAGNCTYCFSG